MANLNIKKCGIVAPSVEDIVIVGNPTLDKVVMKDGSVRFSIGGPPYYIGLALAELGYRPLAVGVVGRGIKRAVEDLLGSIGVVPMLLPDEETTTFELDYTHVPRRVRLLKKPSTRIGSVPQGRLCIVAPVFDEAAEVVPSCMLNALDVQGFVRSGMWRGWDEYDILHISIDDVELDDTSLRRMSRGKIVLYTLGPKGLYIYRDGEATRLEVDGVEGDETGAGDTFLAVFSVRTMEGWDVFDAACDAARRVVGKVLTGRPSPYVVRCEPTPT